MKYTFLTDTINVNQSLINYINRNQNMSIEENGDKTLITVEKPKDLHELDFDKEILLSSNEFKRFLENTEGLVISKIDDTPLYKVHDRISYLDNIHEVLHLTKNQLSFLSLNNEIYNTNKFNFINIKDSILLHEAKPDLATTIIQGNIEDLIENNLIDNFSQIATLLNNQFMITDSSISLTKDKILNNINEAGFFPSPDMISEFVIGKTLAKGFDLKDVKDLSKDILQKFLTDNFIKEFEGNIEDLNSKMIFINQEEFKAKFSRFGNVNNTATYIYSNVFEKNTLKSIFEELKEKTLNIPSKRFIEYGENLKQSQEVIKIINEAKVNRFVSLELISKNNTKDYLRLEDISIRDLDTLLKISKNNEQQFNLLNVGENFSTPITQDNLLIDKDGDFIKFSDYKIGNIVKNSSIDKEANIFFKDDLSNSYYSDMANLIEWISQQHSFIKIDTSSLDGKSRLIINGNFLQLPNNDNALPFNLFLIKHLKEKNLLPDVYKPNDFYFDQFNLINSTEETLKAELITYFAGLNNNNFQITNTDNETRFEIFPTKDNLNKIDVVTIKDKGNQFKNFFQTISEAKKESLKVKFEDFEMKDLEINFRVRRF